MERNDLQLVPIDNPFEVLDSVALFDSAQLRSLLAAVIPPSQSGNWWFANAGPSSSQLLLPSTD
jgi:hypothetical protein